MNNYTLPRLAVLATLACSAALRAATPLVEIDFNDAAGNASLASRGSASATGSWQGASPLTPPAYSANDAPVNAAGYSGSFNGGWESGSNGSYASFGGIGALDGLTSFTITGWINPASSQAQANGNARLVVYKGNLAQGNGIDVFLSGSGATTRLSIGVDGTTVTDTTTSITAGQWTFFAITYNGAATTNNLSFYLGDQSTLGLAYTTTLNQGVVGTAVGQVLTLGGAAATANRNYSGLIDDIHIYGSKTDGSGILSSTEIDAIRLQNDAPSAVPEPGASALLTGAAGLIGAACLRRRRGGIRA